MESSAIYLINDARMELIDLWVEGNSEPFNFMELSLDYSYVGDDGKAVVMPLPSLMLDMDALIELSALISRAMVRLEDSNGAEIVGWDVIADEDEDWYEDGYDPNAGPPLD
jgi:hypothetical protein